jgi:hypothetical protein
MRHLVLLISYCFALSVASAQTINLSLPLNGSVFQQDNNGRGRIKVTGTFNSAAYSRNYTEINAELYALRVSDGTNQNAGISTPPLYTFTLTRNGTAFIGSYEVPAGWYALVLRAKRVVSSMFLVSFSETLSDRIKVGVGEVFLVAGQSNAQGLPNRPAENDINIARPLPTYQRNGITFTINARQSANQISTTYTTACGSGARLSAGELTADTDAVLA